MTDDNITVGTNWGTWGGAIVAGMGGLTLSEWMALAGLAVALIGMVTNILHKRALRRMRREEIEILRGKSR